MTTTVTSKTGKQITKERGMSICYIWEREQTEPGLHGVQYTATNENVAPPESGPTKVPGAENLVYPESLYDDWKLIGTAKGVSYTNVLGAFVELETPVMAGTPLEVEEVVRMNWYSRV